VAVFTAPHEDRAAAHFATHLTTCRGIIEQLEQVEIDTFPTALVTELGFDLLTQKVVLVGTAPR
jgi:hypothetical protein